MSSAGQDCLFRFGCLDDHNSPREFFHLNRFSEETTSGVPRLAIGSTSPLPVFLKLAAVLKPPFDVLYILHTSRCDNELGRYQSPPIDASTFEAFTTKFADFLSTDGRHDLWLHSRSPEGTVAWDRHNLIYAYGPLDRFADVLRAEGLIEGVVSLPTLHTHHYHACFDDDERGILQYVDWTRSPLWPGDIQYQP
jgi:hypothetical protein